MTDPRLNSNAEKKKIGTMINNKPKPGKVVDRDKEASGIPDAVKGIIALSAKRPEMNDPTGVKTESDDDDLDFGNWEPPRREEEELARREK
ncbi:hypothetical protein CHS0354_035027 [Potamilus streckersoni]|uniref:Uncharacterized protein n=1 Tax=Potamilus streckersoni TaxID=2493646 RepID=A0AAE0SDF2_9BIVA|nr:hypothetical protein CHS0354_035027 [Potamilus streckersoni]